MDFKNIVPGKSIALFVKNIQVFKTDEPGKTILPFFADGYPGIMYQQTPNGLYVMPHNKKMPELFLYGQTIHPIELKMEGSYKLIVFQLYPFVLKSLFDLNPKNMNDDCFDLLKMKNLNIKKIIANINKTDVPEERVGILSSFLYAVFQAKKETIDYKIQQSIQMIINNNGQLAIKELRDRLKITERTFERRFIAEAGVSPKQFSKIIQFQLSLNQLADNNYSKLSDIVYDNGFADQSHFIKVFKAYTGKTPKTFKSISS